MFLGPDQMNRAARSCPVCTPTLIVSLFPGCRVICNADVERSVGTLKDIAVEHEMVQLVPLAPAARDTIPSSGMVEAGGVEPPSEKRYGPKPTCLSQFGVRPHPCGRAARSPAALGMSKMRNQLVR